MRALSSLAVVVALATSLTACGARGGGAPGSAPSAPPATVQVTNHNWADMVIYLVRSSTRVRLGTVTSMNTARFRIPNGMITSGSSIHLHADPIGSRDGYVTPALQVSPGRQVELRLQNHLAISSVSVW
jgi:predicted small lipoprotein YifL